MAVVLFEDEQVANLYPVTLGRPAFAISCGGYRLIDLVRESGRPLEYLVRPHLRRLQGLDFPGDVAKPLQPTLLVNARLVPSVAALSELERLLTAGRPGIVQSGESIAAALVPPESRRLVDEELAAKFEREPPSNNARPPSKAHPLGQHLLPALKADLPLFEFPHDILRHHLAILPENLNRRLTRGQFQEIAAGVYAAPGTQLSAQVVTNTKAGPIVLEAGATVGPYSYLAGPAYLGANARVIEHASIKDGVMLGHTTKIGGEVEASIIEPYSNKQHHGFLGHSYLGSWVNLGAGTCNSDLKNTYGKVNMEYSGQKVATGMQFVGCLIGDYAKTAINTGIFTGKTIGACSMLYGFVTTNVPSFVNYARSFGQVTEAPVEVMIATQARMFARRAVQQRECDIQLLRDMYELTRDERLRLGNPLATEPLSL